MTLAIIVFMGVALALATFLIVTSLRPSRDEERALILAQEREHTARQVAQRAREQRARWEAMFASDLERQREAAAEDPRGTGDGLGSEREPAPAPQRSRRFRRDVPAPFTR